MKTKILKNLSILLSFGLIVKVLGLFHRIAITRELSLEGLALYTKMMPISSLFCVIAAFSLGPTITQMVAKNITKRPYSNRDLILKGFKIATITASIVSILHLLLNRFITHYLLQNDELFIPFICFIPLYYLQSYTGIFKGYFHGHNKMETYAIGQLIEQIIRIILIYVFIAPMLKESLESGIIASVLSLSIGELVQNIYLFFAAIKMTKLKNKVSIKADNKAIISTSINLTSSKLTSAICNFCEPIIFTHAFLKTGMNATLANELYAIIYGYVLPLIFITSFITTAIETAILPELATYQKENNYHKIHHLLNKALSLSYIPAVVTTIIFYFFSSEIIYLFYNTTSGASYLKCLAIPSFFSYFDGVFISALICSGQEKKLAKINLLANFFYLLSIYLLVQIPMINILGIIITLSLYMIISPIIYYRYASKTLGYHLPKKSYLFLLIYLSVFFIHYLSNNLVLAITPFFLIIPFLLKKKKLHRHLLNN